jgi:hypothetical protein
MIGIGGVRIRIRMRAIAISPVWIGSDHAVAIVSAMGNAAMPHMFDRGLVCQDAGRVPHGKRVRR